MDQQDLRTLHILEEIEKEGTSSQRDLSRKLNISLGLVNSFVKRLTQKGYFKITTIPKNRVRYLLTPKGAAEKTRLTYEYIQSSISFYHSSMHKVRELLVDLSEENVQKIVFYGVSDLAEITYFLMQETSIQLVAIADEKKSGKLIDKEIVIGIEQLSGLSFDRILITDILDPLNAFEALKKVGVKTEKIVMV